MGNPIALDDAIWVADGYGAIGKPLTQSAVCVSYRLALLGARLTLLGFERYPHGAKANVHVYAAALPHTLLPSVQPSLAQQLGEPNVQCMFVFAHSHIVEFRRCGWQGTPPLYIRNACGVIRSSSPFSIEARSSLVMNSKTAGLPDSSTLAAVCIAGTMWSGCSIA